MSEWIVWTSPASRGQSSTCKSPFCAGLRQEYHPSREKKGSNFESQLTYGGSWRKTRKAGKEAGESQLRIESISPSGLTVNDACSDVRKLACTQN